MYDRAAIVENLRSKIASMPQTGSAMAATTFAPTLPQQQGGRQVMLRRVIGSQLVSRRDIFQQLGFLATDDQHELWRVSTRISTEMGNYGEFLQKLDQQVVRFLEVQKASYGAPIRARVCGAVPLIQMAQRQLLTDLINSFLIAFLLIGFTMMALLINPWGGLLSMIPNVFPTLLVFGINGWRGNSVDIGTMMTACIALGIAVDDTLHFLICFRRSVQRGNSRVEATRKAFRDVAGAMLQTSIICGLGMTVFVLSPFGPIAGFAGMMTALLAAALIGDLVILPAMLVSPLGKYFLPRQSALCTDESKVERSLNPIS